MTRGWIIAGAVALIIIALVSLNIIKPQQDTSTSTSTQTQYMQTYEVSE